MKEFFKNETVQLVTTISTFVAILILVSYIFVFHDRLVVKELPENTVQVEYVLHMPSGPVSRTYVTQLRGEDYTYGQWSSRGTNTIELYGGPTDRSRIWFGTIGNHKCIYEGTVYPEVVSIKVINK